VENSNLKFLDVEQAMAMWQLSSDQLKGVAMVDLVPYVKSNLKHWGHA